MIEEEEIIEIVQKKLEGELSAAEAMQLDKWLAMPENTSGL